MSTPEHKEVVDEKAGSETVNKDGSSEMATPALDDDFDMHLSTYASVYPIEARPSIHRKTEDTAE